MNKLSIIVDEVCKYFGVSPSRVFEITRKGNIPKYRFFIFYFARKFTKLSTNDIGKAGVHVGASRKAWDHSSVLHGCKQIDNWKDTDLEVRHDQEQLCKKLSILVKGKVDRNEIITRSAFCLKKSKLTSSILLTNNDNELKEVIGEFIKSA